MSSPQPLDLARSLLSSAQGDALMVRALLASPVVPQWGIAFHGQQAIEKAMKAVLAARGIHFPFTHDLQTLLDLLAHAGGPPPPDTKLFIPLTPYGVFFRYSCSADEKLPDELIPDLLAAAVDRIIAWAKNNID